MFCSKAGVELANEDEQIAPCAVAVEKPLENYTFLTGNKRASETFGFVVRQPGNLRRFSNVHDYSD